MQVDRMKEEFIRAAVLYGDATLEGKARIVNKQNRILNELYKVVRGNFALYESVMYQLLSNENGYVRLHAACCLLSVCPTEAKEALVKLSSEKGTLGFDAKMTLKEWERGTLNI